MDRRQLAGVAADAVLEVEFYHDIDDTTLSAGVNHACALSAVDDSDVGGEVVCWGDNHLGQSDPPSVSTKWLRVSCGFHSHFPSCPGHLCANQCCYGPHVWSDN